MPAARDAGTAHPVPQHNSLCPALPWGRCPPIRSVNTQDTGRGGGRRWEGREEIGRGSQTLPSKETLPRCQPLLWVPLCPTLSHPLDALCLTRLQSLPGLTGRLAVNGLLGGRVARGVRPTLLTVPRLVPGPSGQNPRWARREARGHCRYMGTGRRREGPGRDHKNRVWQDACPLQAGRPGLLCSAAVVFSCASCFHQPETC